MSFGRVLCQLRASVSFPIRHDMDPKQLFRLKEKLHKELLDRAETMEFESEQDKLRFIETSIEAQVDFYLHAVNEIFDKAS